MQKARQAGVPQQQPTDAWTRQPVHHGSGGAWSNGTTGQGHNTAVALSRRIQHCGSWQELAVVWAQQGAWMNAVHLTALLVRAAKLPAPTGPHRPSKGRPASSRSPRAAERPSGGAPTDADVDAYNT